MNVLEFTPSALYLRIVSLYCFCCSPLPLILSYYIIVRYSLCKHTAHVFEQCLGTIERISCHKEVLCQLQCHSIQSCLNTTSPQSQRPKYQQSIKYTAEADIGSTPILGIFDTESLFPHFAGFKVPVTSLRWHIAQIVSFLPSLACEESFKHTRTERAPSLSTTPKFLQSINRLLSVIFFSIFRA